jgi:hypothetical protein
VVGYSGFRCSIRQQHEGITDDRKHPRRKRSTDLEIQKKSYSALRVSSTTYYTSSEARQQEYMWIASTFSSS